MSNTENQQTREDYAAGFLRVELEKAGERLDEVAAALERFFADTYLPEYWNPGREICRMELLQDTIRVLREQLAVAEIAVKAQRLAQQVAAARSGDPDTVRTADCASRWIP